MNSIGNDIVDLNFIDKERTEAKAFYSKILSETEQQLYQTHFSAIPFWQYVWLLWSTKEAVYKFAKRLQPNLVFSPVKISLESEFAECKNLQNGSDEIKFCSSLNSVNSDEIYCHSTITPNYIHTIANNTSSFGEVISGIKQMGSSVYEDQSAAVRDFLSGKLNAIIPDAIISFTKNEAGYPVILNNGIDTQILASFAHHGNYVAYAFKVI